MSDISSSVFYEWSVVGAQIKMTAIHELSGLEVSVMGPRTAPHTYLRQLARRKLQIRLKKMHIEG